jgi:hypothetical protein
MWASSIIRRLASAVGLVILFSFAQAAFAADILIGDAKSQPPLVGRTVHASSDESAPAGPRPQRFYESDGDCGEGRPSLKHCAHSADGEVGGRYRVLAHHSNCQ